MLARLTDGDAVYHGEVRPPDLAWLRNALKDGPLTRREIAKAHRFGIWKVNQDVSIAVALGLVRSWHEKGRRGGVWLVALVHQEGKR